MAKFNKDTFLNDITGKVQSAIDKNLITSEDVQNNDKERLHGFIQYELLEYIEDRKFALDVLKDFNYDEKTAWKTLEEKYGKIQSVLDLALINLFKFLEAEKADTYEYYSHDNNQKGRPMLDYVHELEDMPGSEDDDPSNEGFFNKNDDDDDYTDESPEPQRRRLRIPQ